MGDPSRKGRSHLPDTDGPPAHEGRLLWAAIGILAVTFGLKAIGFALAFSQAVLGTVVPPQVVKALTIGPLAGLLFAGVSLFQIKWNPVPWWTPTFRGTIVVLDIAVVLLGIFLLLYGLPVASAWPESSPTLSYLALLALPVFTIILILCVWWLVLYFRMIKRLVGGG
ncbi:MAG: hypothetical protein AABY65_05540 [Nitrospirota bacterium]